MFKRRNLVPRVSHQRGCERRRCRRRRHRTRPRVMPLAILTMKNEVHRSMSMVLRYYKRYYTEKERYI